jgi:hypothetical protein
MNDRRPDGGRRLGPLDERVIAVMAAQADARHVLAFDADAVFRGDDGRFALQDGFAILIGADGFQPDEAFLVLLLQHGHGRGDGVARKNRLGEGDGLAEIDAAGTGQGGAQNGGDQRRRPHAMGNRLAEDVLRRELGIEMGRVHIAGNEGEQFDVILGDGALQRSGVADPDLVIGAVFEKDIDHGLGTPTSGIHRFRGLLQARDTPYAPRHVRGGRIRSAEDCFASHSLQPVHQEPDFSVAGFQPLVRAEDLIAVAVMRDAVVTAIVTGLADDAGIVPAIGQGEGDIRVGQLVDLVDRPPRRDVVVLGADGEDRHAQTLQGDRPAIDHEAPIGESLLM